MSQVVSRIIVGEDTTAVTVLTERIDWAAYARVSGQLFQHERLHAEGGTVNVSAIRNNISLIFQPSANSLFAEPLYPPVGGRTVV
jgi:hypothetical protein